MGIEEKTIESETQNLKVQVDQYCKDNDFDQVPLGAQAEAIMYLEFKFRQIDNDVNVDDEFKFLRDYWAKKEKDQAEMNLNAFQKDFLLSSKKAIIEEHKSLSIFSDEKNKSIAEKIIQLEALSLIKANTTKKYRDLVILLYFYYLSQYEDFLPSDKKPNKNIPNDKIDYSNIPDDARKSLEAFEKLIIDYKSILDNTNNGGIPSSIYILVNSCSKELVNIKSILGSEHILYKQSSNKIVNLSTSILMEWVKSNISFLNTMPVLINECNNAFEEINKIEMSEGTRNGFNKIKSSFDSFKQQKRQKAKSGCYIATLAYGDYDHPQVIILRNFRDSFLQNYLGGRIFIKCYYFISPLIVSLFKNNSFFIKCSRVFLNFLISVVLKK